jgi:hypothetical protein
MVFKLKFEETVTADKLAESEIDFRNSRNSGWRPRPAAVSAAEDNMIMIVEVIDESFRTVRVWRQKRADF